jgi:hypothetical protein
MTVFVAWYKDDDALFRKRFKEITGVSIQKNPIINMQEQKYMVGHKLTHNQIALISQEFEIDISLGQPPMNWEQKIEEDYLP